MHDLIFEYKLNSKIKKDLKSFVPKLANELKILDKDFTILFSDDETIQKLNYQYRNKDKPTDVLSFYIDDDEDFVSIKNFIGDIIISIDTAQRQAENKGHSLFNEISILLIHGLLHLLGYDHEQDESSRIEMEKKENKLRGMFVK
ncbi:MAG: rRNA maturation RNase YbeY [Pseudomonadota bacterium]